MKKHCIVLCLIVLIMCTPATSSTLFDKFGSSISKIKETVSNTISKAKLGNLFPSILKPSPSACWVCTLLMNAMMKHTELSGLKIDDFIMNHFCTMFPKEAKGLCKDFINSHGSSFITAFIHSSSPDEVCRAINLCDKPQCTLIPPGQGPKMSFSDDWAQHLQVDIPQVEVYPVEGLEDIPAQLLGEESIIADNNFSILEWDDDAVSTASIIKWFKELQSHGKSPKDWIKTLIDRMASNHTPPFDFDGDKFSAVSGELRGYNWRGRDCNDNDAQIYPGRKTNPHGSLPIDYNCNGISGVDPATSKSYEDLFCANTNQLGVMVLGDSAGAHAEPPPEWINGSAWGNYTFKDLIRSLADEIDLPHFSGYTGYADTGYTGPVSSVYKHLVQRNKCNFRDYQNIAVNGASSANSLKSVSRLARDRENDNPLLIFLELIGNDVCNSHEDFDHMTTPDEFRENILNILDYLDTVVPPGSHLVTLGLVNGSLIYEAVNGRMHPSGVTYNQLYDFQNCLGASMCWGWLNTNQTVRDFTTQRASDLNQVYREIFSTYQAKNFDFIYYDFPVKPIWDEYLAEGKDVYELLEPVDGFHPSQILHAKLGDWLWNSLMKDRPEWLGEENPNNDKITQLFGDQGGY